MMSTCSCGLKVHNRNYSSHRHPQKFQCSECGTFAERKSQMMVHMHNEHKTTLIMDYKHDNVTLCFGQKVREFAPIHRKNKN